MKKKSIRISIAVVALMAACVVITACPNKDAIKSASDAVNRYGTTLSSLQDAEITLHTDGKVPEAAHVAVLHAEIMAARAGHSLDAGIGVAAKGGDPAQYVDLASQSLKEMLDVINADPVTKQNLALAANAADAALKNAITLIEALRANAKPSPATPAPTAPTAMWLFLAMGMFPMMAAAGVGITGVIQLLNLIVQLEPVAFDLIVKLATSLKGKSTEEILAMNEAIFNKVEQTALDELSKVTPPATT